jgi:hypothetical protein
MGRRAALLLAGALALAGTATTTRAASGNATATQAYLGASYTLLRAARAREASSEAALQNLLAGVRRECPNVAAESPENPDSEELSNEVVGAMIIVGTHPDEKAISRFARAVAGLRWSNRTLTSTIRSYAAKLKTLSTLTAPSLCAEVHAWAGSGFRTLPPATAAFNLRYKAVNVSIGELPEQLLAPYERPAEKSIVAQIGQLEARVAEFEAKAVETYAQIMSALDLNP